MRTAPINLRAAPQQRAVIDFAAALMGKTRSDFMLESAYQRAQDVILDQRLFCVDKMKFDLFNEILAQPISDNPNLQTLFNTPSPWDKK